MSGSKPGRLLFLDAFRGCAIVLMVGYHFCFDLAHFGYIRADFNHDWRWLSFRAVILSSFLLAAGASLTIGAARGAGGLRFWKGVAKVAAAAALVSAASRAVFPETWIFFGVLHCIALSRIIGLAFLGRPRAALAAGLAVVAAGHLLKVPLFDAPPLRWVGLMTRKPLTEDYVPVFPWTGVFLIGMWAGERLLNWSRLEGLRAWRNERAAARALAWAGRRSLMIYLLHQPLLFAAFHAVDALAR